MSAAPTLSVLLEQFVRSSQAIALPDVTRRRLVEDERIRLMEQVVAAAGFLRCAADALVADNESFARIVGPLDAAVEPDLGQELDRAERRLRALYCEQVKELAFRGSQVDAELAAYRREKHPNFLKADAEEERRRLKRRIARIGRVLLELDARRQAEAV